MPTLGREFISSPEIAAAGAGAGGTNNEVVTSTAAAAATAAEVIMSNPEAITSSAQDAVETDNTDNENDISTIATTPASVKKYTTVDGKGLWRSWKRNFKNKLLALLDLIDNSLDAAIITKDNNNSSSQVEDFVGRVHIYPDDVETTTITLDDDDDDNAPDTMQSSSSSSSSRYFATQQQQQPAAVTSATTTTTRRSTGLVILNNSHRPIKSMKDCLGVYNSSKVNSGAGDIGENGVGLKQGCATLSNLSFVLILNKEEGYVELGVIAEVLQTVEGPDLPWFRFDITNNDDDDDDDYDKAVQSLKEQMTELFHTQEEQNHVAKCIQKYGGGNNNEEISLQKGIDRLCDHFLSMMTFYNSQYVFGVILDKMSYSNPKKKSDEGSNHQQQPASPIQDLRAEIPKTYLHVPPSFDFRIGNSSMNREKIVFHYWPQRLVELSSFTIQINKDIPFTQNGFNQNTADNSYKLRIFCGFDRMRMNEKEARVTGSLYIYSRMSGRLIVYKEDARADLKLNNGGSMYCSGLTIGEYILVYLFIPYAHSVISMYN